MRYQEFVPEAINLTHYSQQIEDAIYAGMRLAVKEFATTHGQHPEFEQEFEEGYSQKFRDWMRTELLKTFDIYITSQLKQTVRNDLKLQVSNITFQPFKNENTGGHVEQHNLVVLNVLNLNKLAARFVENVVDMVFNSYSEGEYVNALYSILDSIAETEKKSLDRHSAYAFERMDDTVESLTDILLHELVHVKQHSNQNHRWLDHGTEYRSYLDKRKNEFYNLAGEKQSRPLGKKKEERYFDLYLASPQEIPAFAHQMAMSIIRSYEMNQATSLGDLPTLDPSDFTYAVKSILGGRYQDPKNAKQQMVFRRYLKLVYQEVQHYLEQLRKKLGTPAPIRTETTAPFERADFTNLSTGA